MQKIKYRNLTHYTNQLLPFRKPQSVKEANANNQCQELKDFWERNPELKQHIQNKAHEETQTPELKQWWEDFNSRYPVKEQPTLFERVPGMGQMWGTDLQGNVTNPELTTDR